MSRKVYSPCSKDESKYKRFTFKNSFSNDFLQTLPLQFELNYEEFQNKLISILKNFSFRREEGIRTLETLPFTRFPSVRLRPLGHLSVSEKNYITFTKDVNLYYLAFK